MAVVVKNCSYCLVHVPGFIRFGSKPFREIETNNDLCKVIYENVRSYNEALAYPPNQVFIGNKHPDDLNDIPQPWYENPIDDAKRKGPFGEIMSEDEFIGWLKMADDFNLVCLEPNFINQIKDKVASHPLVHDEDHNKIGEGKPFKDIHQKIDEGSALPIYHDGSVVGSLRRDHDRDETLNAHVLMENLMAKASGALGMLHLINNAGISPNDVDFIIDCSETAVGDRYNRGGGSLSKAIGEMCHCENATGCDVRAFCAAPIHAILNAAGLVEAGIFKKVVVIGGGCLSKIGMKYEGHLKHNMPILEDVLATIAFLITKDDDGESPIIRLDCVGKHDIGAGSSQQAIMTSLILKPLSQIGMKMMDIDKYATEMHNPEITLPAGSGNTPYTNYKIMASLAVINKEIESTEIERFVRDHGMPGFSPTQGHVPAAVPFLGHAIEAMKKGEMKRAMFIAKGSLFLGRMSQLSDGMSFLLEVNGKKSRS
ncbi:MAG: glycine/sarcosine/betaine reductase complex component C subunit beta [Planctomycetota bacterium]|jgi:betaine reductase